MSVTAYKRTISLTEEPRQIERRILVGVTSELERLYEEFDTAETRLDRLRILSGGLQHWLWKNQQIWLTFKIDLMESNNGLSPELRASLISLSAWVEKHTQGVMAGGKLVKPLIDVNRNIIEGLSGRSGQSLAAE